MPEALDRKPAANLTSAPEGASPKPLKATLNLPQTAFPMKANLPVNEPLRLAAWEQMGLYNEIRRQSAGRPRYILHDGPPYANGAIHLGHALNKTLKDFVVKTRTMAGFDAPYVPGWDCHGLPIEIKVDEQLGRKKLEMDPVAVRRACREYAQKYLDLQRSQFIRMGIFGRWFEPYATMDPVYEARIAETFFHFFQNGFVYKGLKPVSWCIHDRTALAEAEVEYANHTSPSIYVRYKLTSDPTPIHPDLVAATAPGAPSKLRLGGIEPQTSAEPSKPIYAIIWTTTPWTLPASLAIAFHPEMEYVAIDCADGIYIVAQALLSSVIVHAHLMSGRHSAQPASQADMLAAFKGFHLDRATFQHPFLDREILGILATYVTSDQGTGAVHTAPAHGVDDFATGQRYQLENVQYVDDAGRQRHTGQHGGGAHPQPYEDLTVFKSNPVILDLLRRHNALLAATEFQHSYPHCWRCHNPVITRATEQWFISMETPMPQPSSPSQSPAASTSSKIVILSEAKDPLPAPPSNIVILSEAKDPLLPPPNTVILSEAKDPLLPPPNIVILSEAKDPLFPPPNIVILSEAKDPLPPPTEPAIPLPEAVILSEAQNDGSSPNSPRNTETTFRQRALEEIEHVSWDPAWGKERITNMVATRPDWCISRQRIWGVPIAVFLCRKCGEPLKDPAVNKQIVTLFEKDSADAWYFAENTPEKLLPPNTACRNCAHTDFRKEMDILDVWFESGASSHAVLDFDPDTQQLPTDPDKRADLYAEGGDQHRGWFMSSLLCGIGMHNRAPFKTVATYGWTLDEKGRALSKSLGNFIDPVAVMDQLGGDIVRLWVASVDFREDVVASLPLLKRLAEEIYRKLRNTFRFLLGALSETNPTTGEVHAFNPRPIAEGGDAVPFDQMQPIDQYILAKTAELVRKVRKAYGAPEDRNVAPGQDTAKLKLEAFEFHRVYHLLNEFCNSELSAFYLDVLKDRLYTYPIAFKPGRPPQAPGLPTQQDLYIARRGAQTAIYKITDALARLTAPILSFTADEVWQSLPATPNRPTSVHLTLFPTPEDLAPVQSLPDPATNLSNIVILSEAKDLLSSAPPANPSSRPEAQPERRDPRGSNHAGTTPDLLAGWEALLTRRAEILAKLESLRAKKVIGKALEATVTLYTSGAPDETLLRTYEASLPELFNVSEVHLLSVTHNDPDYLPNLDLERSTAPKCDRCWRHVPDVGHSPSYPTVCLRCVEALDAIDFPPYQTPTA